MEDLANNILNIASEWDIDHSRELYRLENWGETYFSINKKGNIIVRPKK
jgi:arginine decarboxylase